MAAELSPQRQLVLEQKYRRFENSVQIGDHLDNKAASFLQVGGLIITLTGVVKIPNFVANPNTWGTIGIFLAFLAFAGMIMSALLAWNPSDLSLPGSDEWDEIFVDYIDPKIEDCFNQILADLHEAIDLSTRRNALKARYVKWSAGLFSVQILGILLLALLV